jgi:hypothetical protein
MEGPDACLEFPVDRASLPFHATQDYGRKALEAIGGPYLDDVVAFPLRAVDLGLYVPQVRMRRSRNELPHRRSYGIRLDQVLRRNVHTAAQVRDFCRMPRDVQLILLSFADDDVLEEFWSDEARFRAVAQGGWDLITAPSYSLWYRRPRPLHFHSIKRSYDAFEALQALGARAVPRAEFIDRRDVEVQADWFTANPDVEMVSFDWMTCRQDRDFLKGAEFLALFDQSTGERLRYLINGTTAFARLKYLLELLGAERLTVTDATAAIPPQQIRPAEDLATDLLTHSAWTRRVAGREAVIHKAVWAAEAERRRAQKLKPAPATPRSAQNA